MGKPLEMRETAREDLLWELECAISDAVDDGRWARTAAEHSLEIVERYYAGLQKLTSCKASDGLRAAIWETLALSPLGDEQIAQFHAALSRAGLAVVSMESDRTEPTKAEATDRS